MSFSTIMGYQQPTSGHLNHMDSESFFQIVKIIGRVAGIISQSINILPMPLAAIQIDTASFFIQEGLQGLRLLSTVNNSDYSILS